MTEQTNEVQAPSVLFRYLWGGQLISNLGTQTSLYGIGLWLFSQSGDLLDFGLVAVVVRLSSLIPLLIAEEERLQRANGLFATADGLGVTVTPSLGSWLEAVWGLAGVLALDGITFVLALLAVVIAPWQRQIQHLQQAVVSERTPWAPRSTIRRGMELWQRSWSARSLCPNAYGDSGICLCRLVGVVFPAWLSLAYLPERMGGLGWLIVAGLVPRVLWLHERSRYTFGMRS